MENNSICLRIKDYRSIADCISIIRNYTTDSIGVIKTKIQNGKPVLSCKYTDRVGLSKLIQCYYELSAQEIDLTLHELDNEITTIRFLENLLSSYDEISGEIDSPESL